MLAGQGALIWCLVQVVPPVGSVQSSRAVVVWNALVVNGAVITASPGEAGS
jgi:hypothetical protein